MTVPVSDIEARLRRARVEGFLRPGSPDTNPKFAEADPLAALIAKTASIYSQAIRADTRAAYARRWNRFETWCSAHGLAAIPAEPETVMIFLASLLKGMDGASLNTLRGYTAAIGRVHREAGVQAPNDAPLLSQFMRGLARHTETRPPRPVNTGALRVGDVRKVMRHLRTLEVDSRAVRDAALLAAHHAGFGDGEIQRMESQHFTFDDAAVSIVVPATRADRRTSTRTFPTGDDHGTLLHQTLTAWRAISGDDFAQPVFTAVDPSGWTGGERLAHRAVFKIRTSRIDSLSARGHPVDVPAAIRILSGAPSEVLRDRALLLLGFAMSARRGEVVNLRWSDLVERANGLITHIRSSKTDLSGRGVDIGVPSGQSELTDPVAAVTAWRDRVATQLGSDAVSGERWVFTHVGRAGRITDTPLSPEALTRLVRRRAEQGGVSDRMGGRSLRAGFITTAAEMGIPIDEIAKQSRHKTLDSLVLYVRNADPLLRSPAGEVGL